MTSAGHAGDAAQARLFGLMLGVFMGGGMLASVEALLVPRLRLTLGLDYARALAVQLAYYASYLLLAFPATTLTARLGAMRATALGSAIVALGTLALAGALAARSFAAVMAALLLTSAGTTILQIACNGLMATRERGVSRFTTLQAFNSLGTVIGPLVATGALLGGGGRAACLPFLGFAAGFALLAARIHRDRALLPRGAVARPDARALAALARTPVVARGIAAIFAYVGAEVTIGSLLPSYLMLGDRGGLAPVAAGRLVALYWLGAMIGRFAGGWLLRRMAAATMLGGAAAAAAALCAVAVLPTGAIGAAALLAVGLANSVMFPTIFALAMPRAAGDVPAASMLLCIAVVGGAIVPVMTGAIADRSTLSLSLLLPLGCYAAILALVRGARPGSATP